MCGNHCLTVLKRRKVPQLWRPPKGPYPPPDIINPPWSHGMGQSWVSSENCSREMVVMVVTIPVNHHSNSTDFDEFQHLRKWQSRQLEHKKTIIYLFYIFYVYSAYHNYMDNCFHRGDKMNCADYSNYPQYAIPLNLTAPCVFGKYFNSLNYFIRL